MRRIKSLTRQPTPLVIVSCGKDKITAVAKDDTREWAGLLIGRRDVAIAKTFVVCHVVDVPNRHPNPEDNVRVTVEDARRACASVDIPNDMEVIGYAHSHRTGASCEPSETDLAIPDGYVGAVVQTNGNITWYTHGMVVSREAPMPSFRHEGDAGGGTLFGS